MVWYARIINFAGIRIHWFEHSEFSAFSAVEFRTCQNYSIRELHSTLTSIDGTDPSKGVSTGAF